MARLIRNLLTIGALLCLVTAKGQAQSPSVVSLSLSSTTCPGTGCVEITLTGLGSMAVQVTGTWTGTLTFQSSIDRANFVALSCTPVGGGSPVTTTTTNGVWTCPVQGLALGGAFFLSSAYGSGVAQVTLQTGPAGGGGGGGGGVTGSVTINDPSITTQKQAVNASGQASVTCANCSGSGASAVDLAAFTAGTGSGAPASAIFQTTPSTLTTGTTGVVGMDSRRQLFTTIRDAADNLRGANVTAANALVVDASATTQPVSVASLPLPTGASTAAKQPALGTAGTPSTDVLTIQGAASMTKLLVTPDSVALPANQSMNESQINGVTPAMGNGTTTTGVQRVTLSSDSTGQVAIAGTPTVVLGAGSALAGKVGVDQTTAGSTNLVATSAQGSAAYINDVACDKAVLYDASTSGSTQLVAISASTHVYICGFTLFSAGTVNVGLIAGTGTACASAASGANNVGTSGAAAKLTPAYQLVAQTGLKEPSPTHGYLIDAGSANAVCLNTSAGIAVQFEMYYSQR